MAISKKRALDLRPIRDRADLAAHAIAKHKVEFTLNPEYMTAASYPVDELSWTSVRYGLDDANDVPDDQKGRLRVRGCALGQGTALAPLRYVRRHRRQELQSDAPGQIQRLLEH